MHPRSADSTLPSPRSGGQEGDRRDLEKGRDSAHDESRLPDPIQGLTPKLEARPEEDYYEGDHAEVGGHPHHVRIQEIQHIRTCHDADDKHPHEPRHPRATENRIRQQPSQHDQPQAFRHRSLAYPMDAS